MLVVADRQIEPNNVFIYLHVPKCGGTYAKKVIRKNMNLHMESPFFSKSGMHQPFDSICGHRTNNSYTIHGLMQSQSELRHSPNFVFNTMTVCMVRDPFQWYDSYYYYKRSYEKRHRFPKQPLIPLDSRLDYRDALMGSFSEDKISKCSFTVLQNGFCPSVWMEKLDVGFYTAWLLYIAGDHKKIFDNADKIKNNDFSTIDTSIFGDEIQNIVFCDLDAVDSILQHGISEMTGKKVVIETEARERTTNYDKDYLNSKQILSSNKDIYDLFLWKERFVFNCLRYKERL